MSDQPLPDDRTLRKILDRLKGYTAYKAHQLQTATSDTSKLERALFVIDTWAADADDTGAAWGDSKDAESKEKIARSDRSQEQVERDDAQAAKEAEYRSQLDMDKVKDGLKTQIDNYQEAMKQQADAGQPGFEDKLPQVNRDSDAAKKVVDDDLEKSMDMTERRTAERRQRRKVIANNAESDAEESRAWREDYADQPEKFPDGQRADVKNALGTVGECCAEKGEEIKPLGAPAKPHFASLSKVQDWSTALQGEVDSTGADLVEAKASGKSGAASARSVFTKVEEFQNSVETEANDDLNVYQRWTDRNNRLAAKWINSDSTKHKQWAKAWQKTQEENQ